MKYIIVGIIGFYLGIFTIGGILNFIFNPKEQYTGKDTANFWAYLGGGIGLAIALSLC
jgi:hypothetical protein